MRTLLQARRALASIAIVSRVSASTTPSSTTAELARLGVMPPPKRKSTPRAIMEWKKRLSLKLYTDYERERMRHTSEINRRIARNRVISYIRLNEIRPLLVYIANYVHEIGTCKDYPYDDELVSVVLTYLRRLIDNRGMKEHISDVEEAVLLMEQLREHKAPSESDDVNAVTSAVDEAEKGTFGYDKSSPLLRPINGPMPSENFHGSSFKLPNFTKADYERLFAEQLDYEDRNYVKARNFCRLSQLEPMEQLIEGWQWRPRIEARLKENMGELSDEIPLYHFLSGIDTGECAARLVDCVQSLMCQGQSLVLLTELQKDASRVVLRLVYRTFLDAMGFDLRKVYGKVFDSYIDYYLDDELARKYTIRQWWTMCTRKHDLAPEFYPPLTELFGDPPKELANFLVSAVLEACVFPRKTELAQRTWIGKKAFTYSDVKLEEESALLGEDETKVGLFRMLKVDPELMERMIKHEFEHLLFPCNLLPMKVPPRPWIEYGRCGPTYTSPQKIIREIPEFPHMDVNSESLRRITKPSQARPVFDAINDLGATPWVINKPMLDNLLTAFEMAKDAKNADFLAPLSIPPHICTMPVEDFQEWLEKRGGPDVKTYEVPLEERNEFWRTFHANKKKRNEIYGIWCYVMYRLVLAQYFLNERLYFPHNMDFRGRVYPISPHLNHMGDDINRGLLRFAKGKRLGEVGLRWLKIHCINMTGKMKRAPVAARLAEAEHRLNDIIDSANRPFTGNQWWLDSTEEPWQTLAACLELRNAYLLEKPEDYVSHLPIHQDGSCNGLQHYAALGRDIRGATEVNLLPSDSPNDVYSEVAKRVEDMRVRDESSEDEAVRTTALQLRAELPGRVERKLIKQSVMTTVYGVTLYGASHQIKRQLKAINVTSENSLRHSFYLSRLTFACLNEAFMSSMALKEWFRQCAAVGKWVMQPVRWVTPLGLPVVQPYVKASNLHNRLCLIPVRKQVNAFPPNFVHSLDSTHMMLTALECHRRGLTFAAVHDCFWTHACDVDEMNVVCRDQFIALHSQPLTTELSKFLMAELLTPAIVDGMPYPELADVKKRLQMYIKPGDLDLKQVRHSTYFFS